MTNDQQIAVADRAIALIGAAARLVRDELPDGDGIAEAILDACQWRSGLVERRLSLRGEGAPPALE